jgi:hypothetical protein
MHETPPVRPLFHGDDRIPDAIDRGFELPLRRQVELPHRSDAGLAGGVVHELDA